MGIGNRGSGGQHRQMPDANIHPDYAGPAVASGGRRPSHLDGEGDVPAVGGAGDGGGEDAGGAVFEAAGELAGGLVGLEHADPGQLDARSVVQNLDGAGGEAASVSGPALPFAAGEAHRAPAAAAGLGIGVVLERSCQPVQSRLVGFLAVLSPPGRDVLLAAVPLSSQRR